MPTSKPDDLLRDALQKLEGREAKTATEFSEQLAILKRWYYRTHKTGELILAKADGELPLRKIMNAIGRVSRGAKETFNSPQLETRPPA